MMRRFLILLLVLLPVTLSAQDVNYKRYIHTSGAECDSLYNLLRNARDVLTVDTNGNTLIHHFAAIQLRCPQAFEILAARGVDVNAINKEGKTALDIAARNKDATVIVKLKNMNAELHAKHPDNDLYKAIEAYDVAEINRLCEQETRSTSADAVFRWDTFTVGARVNYTQGDYGFIGIACPVSWHEVDFLPIKHFGFSVGMDVRTTKSTLIAPKISAEYRYFLVVLRGGYAYYTDFDRHEHAPFVEGGFSLLSVLDITYLHTFQLNSNPFGLGSDYLNITLTIPFKVYER